MLSPRDLDVAVRTAIRPTMLRCADIIANTTDDDVMEVQVVLLGTSNTLEQVAKIDRAMVAEQHIRACVRVSDEKAAKLNGGA